MSDNEAAQDKASDAEKLIFDRLERLQSNPDSHSNKSYRSANRDKKWSRPFRNISADRWAELLFALALTVATILNAFIANRQWIAANGQLNAMRDQARAWIKASPIKDGDITYINGIGLSFPFHFDLTNVGHLPAFNVETLSILYTPAEGRRHYGGVAQAMR